MSLGIEFYRNYIGIENLLKVQYETTIKREGLLEGLSSKFLSVRKEDGYLTKYTGVSIKPHLRLPEDLTDEEIRFTFGLNGYVNRKGDTVQIRLDGKIVRMNLKEGWIRPCNQEILNRLYSLHSHPKAKEYIEKGLAVKIEVKDER